MKHDWTASKSDRVFACPASAILPQVIEQPGEGAKRGSAIHKFLADTVQYGRAKAIERVDEYKNVCCSIDLPWLYDLVSPETEVMFGLNPETLDTIEVKGNAERDYSAIPEGWIGGTADLVFVRGGLLHVYDYKTGRDPVEAEGNEQLEVLAVMASIQRFFSEVVVGIVQIHEDGSHTVREHKLDWWQLEQIQEKIKHTWRAIKERSEEPKFATSVNPGVHCRYCPSAPLCPGFFALAKFAVGNELSFGEALNPGEVWLSVQKLERIVWRLKEGLKAVAFQVPVPIPGTDQEVVVSQRVREDIDGRKALPIFKANFTDEERSKLFHVSVKKQDVERVAGERAGEILTELREVGAINETKYEVLTTRKIPCRKLP